MFGTWCDTPGDWARHDQEVARRAKEIAAASLDAEGAYLYPVAEWLYVGEDWSFSDIGRLFGVTRQRVSAVLKQPCPRCRAAGNDQCGYWSEDRGSLWGRPSHPHFEERAAPAIAEEEAIAAWQAEEWRRRV